MQDEFIRISSLGGEKTLRVKLVSWKNDSIHIISLYQVLTDDMMT